MWEQLRQCKSDIMMLQETHATKLDESEWEKEWKGSIFWSHGSSSSAGCAILSKPGISGEILETDRQGRRCTVLLDIEGNKLCVMCLYAPTHTNSEYKLSFFRETMNVIKEWEPHIVAGDLNMYMEELDAGNTIGGRTGTDRVISKLFKSQGYTDIWRRWNQSSKSYTWRNRLRKPYKYSRLDYILVKEDFVHYVKKVHISPFLYSDHEAMNMTLLDLKTDERKPIWKLDTRLLKDKKYIEMVNKIIDDFDGNTKCNYNLAIDTMKAVIRGETI